MEPSIGETWQTQSRKGNLIVKVLTDPAAEWFEAEIVEGKARYMSEANNFMQREHGQGTPGDTLTMRRSLVKFLSRVE